MKAYEEDQQIGRRTSWAVILVLCAGIVAWGVANWMFIQDRPRQWDFGAVPDVPAQSIYSTSAPAAPSLTPRQAPMLPGARRTTTAPTAR